MFRKLPVCIFDKDTREITRQLIVSVPPIRLPFFHLDSILVDKILLAGSNVTIGNHHDSATEPRHLRVHFLDTRLSEFVRVKLKVVEIARMVNIKPQHVDGETVSREKLVALNQLLRVDVGPL
jgi:hypothetical protein